MAFKIENCLTVSDIKKSIELMDEFVDGEYDFLELKNWFSVTDSRNRGFSVYDNSGRMQISLIVSKERINPQTPLCEYEPTMTELRQMKSHHIFLDHEYDKESMSYSIRIACEKWKKDEFIPLPIDICLRAQTSYNRMDYGCEWLGGGDWEEKTMYGETTDFFIVGIILHQPFKHVEQEAKEILDNLEYQKETTQKELGKVLSILKNTDDVIIHKALGRSPRECRVIEFKEKQVVVQFEERTATFPFPESFLNGFLVNPKYQSTIKIAKIMYEDFQALEAEFVEMKRILDKNDFGEIYDIVWKYREKRAHL